jgi:hypothetical protein
LGLKIYHLATLVGLHFGRFFHRLIRSRWLAAPIFGAIFFCFCCNFRNENNQLEFCRMPLIILNAVAEPLDTKTKSVCSVVERSLKIASHIGFRKVT